MSVMAIDRQTGPGPRGEGPGLQPFADTRDHRLYFPAPGHEAVLTGLTEVVQSGHASFVSVTGDSGSGKTYLRTLLHSRLDPAHFVRISIESSLLDFDQLLLEIISQFNGRRAAATSWPDRYDRLAELKRILAQKVVRPNRHLAILLDEAQGLTAQTLENLRQLSNISTEQRGIMTFVLFGTPALDDLCHDLPELERRIGRGLALEPMDRDATRAYVRHQVALTSDHDGPEFSDESWNNLHCLTGGLPGTINRVMREALKTAGRPNSPVTDAMLAQALPAHALPLGGRRVAGWEGCS